MDELPQSARTQNEGGYVHKTVTQSEYDAAESGDPYVQK